MWLKIERMFDKMEGDDLFGNHDAGGPDHATAGKNGRAAVAISISLRPATLYRIGGLHGAKEGNVKRNR